MEEPSLYQIHTIYLSQGVIKN